MFVRPACLRPYREGSHQTADLGIMHFDGKMPGFEELHLGLGQIASVGSAPGKILPHRKQWWLPLPETTMEIGVKVHIGSITQDQIGLSVSPARLAHANWSNVAIQELGRRCLLLMHVDRLVGRRSPKASRVALDGSRQ